MSRGRRVPPTRRPRWGPCLFPPLVTPHGCPPPVPQGRMPRWPQCPQLAAEAETGLRFHLLNGVIFPHLRGLCVTERSTLQIQRSECLREKDACLRRHRQEHRRKVLETLRPSASLSGQGRKEASDMRRQRCQGSSATARTRGMTFATFVSWCPPPALSTASVSQGHCHPAVPRCHHGPRNLSRGDPGGSRCGPCGRGSGREEERRDGVARGWQPAAGGRAVRGLKQVTPLREPGSGGGEAPTAAGREGGRAVPRSPQGPCGTRSSGSPPRAGAVLTPVWGSLALCQPPLPVLPPSPF